MAQTGKALGALFRKHLTPRQIGCTIERTNDTEASHQAETVIRKLLGRPSPWDQGEDSPPAKVETIFLDDKKVGQLAKRWGSGGIAEHMVVVPHIFYMALLKCFRRNLELKASEILSQICLFFDYAVIDRAPEIVKQCFFGERAEVLRYARKMGLPFIDPGRQLFLENLISLACYMIPAQCLVFMDDDFFINHPASIDALVDPLKRGWLMSGRYAKPMDRLHTSFFALRPEALRDELALFDGGENYYADELIDTGTITYRELLNRDKGVFILGEYYDNDLTFGRHLIHCTTELWVDFPQILMFHFEHDKFPKDIGKMKLDMSILLEALALVFQLRPRQGGDYEPVFNEMRMKAFDALVPYFEKIYNNYHWLKRHADSY